MLSLPVIEESQDNKTAEDRPFIFRACVFNGSLSFDLETMLHHISRTPNDLLCHVQRIYYCFTEQQADHLFAALTDLLIILQGKGQALIKRMISGSQSLLSAQQRNLLENAVDEKHLHTLQTVKYSLFATGRIAESELITTQHQASLDDSVDTLSVAHSYLEYSQVDHAIDLLEEALFTDDNEDLQHLLLQIYRSTDNRQRFSDIFTQAEQKDRPLIAEWQQLQQYFSDKPS